MYVKFNVMSRLDGSPYAAALADDMARMRHLLWRTVPLKCPLPCHITFSNKIVRRRIMKLLNVVKFVPNAATCSKHDAVAWLLGSASQLKDIAKAESRSQPVIAADFDT